MVAATCPSWFATPEPGKGVLIVQVYWGVNIEVKSPTQMSLGRLDPAVEGPGYKAFSLAAGRYEIVFDSNGSALSIFDLPVGGTVGISITHDGRGFVGPLQAKLFNVTPPPGCPGAPAPVSEPPAQCPDWYTTPVAGKGMYVVENHTFQNLDLIGVNGTTSNFSLPSKSGDKPGRGVYMLAPGHYEFDTKSGNIGGHITFDIAASQSLFTGVAAVVRSTLGQLGASPLPIPAGCPGHVPGSTAQPSQTAQCPDWYIAPEPGKGMLVIENWFGPKSFSQRAIELIGLEAYTKNNTVPLMPKENEPGRLIVMLPPAHYHFDTRYPTGNADFNITAGQRLVIPIAIVFPVVPHPVYELQTPPGCQ